MAKTISLKASARTLLGRNAVKSLRNNGIIPGVIYGKKGSQAISINRVELRSALQAAHSENVLVDLTLQTEKGAESKFAFLQDMQHDVLKDRVIHVDLHEVSPDEKLHVEIPVVEKGEPDGVKNGGGLLEVALRKLRVECLPKDLPEEIVIDVSALKVGESIHVQDIIMPAGVVCLNSKELTVIAVTAPRVATEEDAATAVTQPEVIKEKKPAAGAADAKAAGGKDAKAPAGKDAKAAPAAKTAGKK